MQDVKEQGFEKLGILTHLLKVETLEPGERNRVFWVVEEEPELTSLRPLREPVGEPMPERVGEDSESSQGRVNGVKILNLLVEVSLLGGVQFDWRCALKQDLCKQSKEIEVLLRGRERERVDSEVRRIDANPHVGAAEEMCKALEAPAQVENKRVRVVFLQVGDEEVEEERFASTSAPKNHGMGDVVVMEVQEVRGVVVRFENRKILLTEMPVLRLATVKGEEKRIICVVGIEKIQRTEVKSVISGNCREKCVQEIVFLFIKLGVVNTEHLIELGACQVHLRRVQVIDDDGEGKLAEIVPLELDLLNALPKFANLGLLRVIS